MVREMVMTASAALTAPRLSAFDLGGLLRPLAILGAVAFAVGFLGFLAFTGADMDDLQMRVSTLPTPAAVVSSPAASPASFDEWNIPKRI